MPPSMTETTSEDVPDVLQPARARKIASFFQVLADPTRVRLVKALADDRWCVSNLAQALEMDQPAVSHQLKYLRQHDLVVWDKQGRHVYYTLNNALLGSILKLVLEQFSCDV